MVKAAAVFVMLFITTNALQGYKYFMDHKGLAHFCTGLQLGSDYNVPLAECANLCNANSSCVGIEFEFQIGSTSYDCELYEETATYPFTMENDYSEEKKKCFRKCDQGCPPNGFCKPCVDGFKEVVLSANDQRSTECIGEGQMRLDRDQGFVISLANCHAACKGNSSCAGHDFLPATLTRAARCRFFAGFMLLERSEKVCFTKCNLDCHSPVGENFTCSSCGADPPPGGAAPTAPTTAPADTPSTAAPSAQRFPSIVVGLVVLLLVR